MPTTSNAVYIRSVTPTSGSIPLTITATVEYNGNVGSAVWNFGDGNTLSTTDLTVNHTYLTPGSYQVSVDAVFIDGSGGLNHGDVWEVGNTGELEGSGVNIQPIVVSAAAVNYPLVPAQNGTRVRIDSPNTNQIHVQVGNPTETWLVGTYIEVLNMSSTAPVDFVPYNGTVTLNFQGGISSLKPGMYGRVSLVSPNVWDLHVHPVSLAAQADVVFTSPAIGDTMSWNGTRWVNTQPLRVHRPAPMIGGSIFVNTNIGSAAHHNVHYRSIAATDITLTVQPDSFFPNTVPYWDDTQDRSTSPMPIGGTLVIGKHAAGDVIFAAGPGVTINSPDLSKISKLNGKATLMKVGPNEYDLEGNLATL